MAKSNRCVKKRICNQDIYLCETTIKQKGLSPTRFLSAYRDAKRKQFIVESSINTKAKMEKQITNYLEKRCRVRGYI